MGGENPEVRRNAQVTLRSTIIWNEDLTLGNDTDPELIYWKVGDLQGQQIVSRICAAHDVENPRNPCGIDRRPWTNSTTNPCV